MSFGRDGEKSTSKIYNRGWVKWNCPQRNFEKGGLVLIIDDRAPRNDWNMARVVDIHLDLNGQVRSVRVTTATMTLDRPIDKLVLILENEE